MFPILPFLPGRRVSVHPSVTAPITYNVGDAKLLVNPGPFISTNYVPIPTAKIPEVISPYLIYPDVNSDQDLQRKVVNAFWDLLENRWLKYGEFEDVYKLLSESNGNVKVYNGSDYKKNSGKVTPAKYNYILNHVINYKELHYILDRYRKNNGLNWWNLESVKDDVKFHIYRQMKKYLKGSDSI